MVEIYVDSYVRVKEHMYYGHGVWIHEEDREDREEYIQGADAGVSFFSGTTRAQKLQVTLVSDTTGGAWQLWDDFRAAVWG